MKFVSKRNLPHNDFWNVDDEIVEARVKTDQKPIGSEVAKRFRPQREQTKIRIRMEKPPAAKRYVAAMQSKCKTKYYIPVNKNRKISKYVQPTVIPEC